MMWIVEVPDMDLIGKGAVVTGGGRGLGRELAKALGRAGSRVLVVARSKAELEQTVREVVAAGGEAHAFVADVADKDAVYAVAGAAAALVGPVELLIHNASALGPVPLRLLFDTACEDFQRVFEVNVLGPFRLTKAIAGPMALRGRGLVVHVSSDAAMGAYPRWGAYGVSKAALDHMGRIWAAELEGTGVRFVSVDPGEMRTRMHADAIPDADPATLADPADVARRIVSRICEIEAVPSGARIEVST
jgi:NAD(P)-dependent dehydrogenase (short-subunit alcohol dehydrogenase family)